MDTDQSVTRDRIPSGKPITTAVYVLIMAVLVNGKRDKKTRHLWTSPRFFSYSRTSEDMDGRRRRRLGRRAGRRNVEKREAVMSCLSGRSRCILVSCHLFTEYFLGILQ